MSIIYPSTDILHKELMPLCMSRSLLQVTSYYFRYSHCYVPKYYPGGGELVKCGNTTLPNNGTACPPEMPDKYEAVCDPAINTEECPYDRGMTPQGKKSHFKASVLRATPSVLS